MLKCRRADEYPRANAVIGTAHRESRGGRSRQAYEMCQSRKAIAARPRAHPEPARLSIRPVTVLASPFVGLADTEKLVDLEPPADIPFLRVMDRVTFEVAPGSTATLSEEKW